MIDKMVIQDWVDVKNEYPLIKWLNEIVELHRFSSYLCRAIRNLCASWNTRIAVPTKQRNETSSTIRFSESLPEENALCLRLVTLCLKPGCLETKCYLGV